MRERAQRRTGSLRYAFRRQSQHLERLKVNRSDIHFPPKHEPLREDVHALGALMGEILREQGGQQLFELVELDRVAAIRGRAGPREAHAELAARVRERPPALAREVVRAFSTWFQSVNLAERVHRIRRRREYLLKDSERPQPGGVEDAIAALKSQGLTAAQVLELIGGLSIEPVFAPHSTEASRRTLLGKQLRIAQRLVERLDPTLTPNEARSVWSSIRMELTAAWQTEELPRERLTVADEREQILFYLVEILYRVVPAFYEEIAQALEKLYGTEAGATRVPAILHVGSWAGGDMDGNPDVHAKSIREALARQQQVIINRYFEECQSIAQRLSQSASRVPAASELTKRVEQYTRLLPGARAITPARHDRMPYRVFLAQLGERLRSTYEGRASGYESARQFRDDVSLIATSLKANKGANAGLFYVERLLRRIDAFGFHLATLDVREHASVLHAVVARGFDDPLWLGRSSRERRDRLAEALEKDRGPVVELDALGKRHLAVFDAIMQGRHRYGPDAIGYFIVSGASGVDGVLRIREQGATIRQGYGLRPIAMRTLERAFNALSLTTAACRRGQLPPDSAEQLEVSALLAQESRAAYRRLVYEQAQFYEYFQAVTPIDVIERMQIGSRSVHRVEGAGLEGLLPVPWVFAWSQTRYMLPGWYGAGSALRAALASFGLARLRAACDGWFFLRNLLDDIETMLARSDPEIARYYDELVPEPLRRFSAEIRSEFDSACEQILAVRGSRALLDSDPTLQRSIQLRNPYLDPIHLIQVDLLQRWRAGGRTDRA